MRHLPAAVTIGLALAISACGDSPIGPTTSGRVEAQIQDSPSGNVTVTGTLSGNVFASVGNGSRWMDIGSPNGITIALQIAGRTTTIHGEGKVATGSFSRVRVVFQGVTARIAGGSRIGDQTLASDTSLVLGGSDQRAEISVPVDSFVIESDTSVRRVIVFELRSHQWLTTTALQSGQVEDSALQAAVTASTRLDRQ